VTVVLEADAAIAGDDVTQRLDRSSIRGPVLGLDIPGKLQVALHHQIAADEDAAFFEFDRVAVLVGDL